MRLSTLCTSLAFWEETLEKGLTWRAVRPILNLLFLSITPTPRGVKFVGPLISTVTCKCCDRSRDSQNLMPKSEEDIYELNAILISERSENDFQLALCAGLFLSQRGFWGICTHHFSKFL